MRIARIAWLERVVHALVEDQGYRLLEGDLFGQWTPSQMVAPREQARLLAPVAPPQIVAIGRNYREHAQEGGDTAPGAPIVFLKGINALNHPDGLIVLPAMAPDEVDYEAELAIVIGREAKNVSEAEALGYVLGYTCANDVSARDCQLRLDKQWTRGKSFDTFCPLGPWIETELDPDAVAVRTRLNGETMQDGHTRDLIFSCSFLISYLSRCMTLAPGCVILTGTPSGVGHFRTPPVHLRPGDVVTVEVEGIGALTNGVEGEKG